MHMLERLIIVSQTQGSSDRQAGTLDQRLRALWTTLIFLSCQLSKLYFRRKSLRRLEFPTTAGELLQAREQQT